MSMSTGDIHELTLDDTLYRFRTPRVHDTAKLRRVLTLQRVRRPDPIEFLVAARAGLTQMAELAGDPEEGARQVELLERFHELMKPTDEDELEEVDPVRRAEHFNKLEDERKEQLQAIYPDVHAIEANLERHHPPYAELKADRDYWDDVSRIEVVRLLLVGIGEGRVVPGEDGLMAEGSYQMIPRDHRMPLATFAYRLLAPREDERKN